MIAYTLDQMQTIAHRVVDKTGRMPDQSFVVWCDRGNFRVRPFSRFVDQDERLIVGVYDVFVQPAMIVEDMQAYQREHFTKIHTHTL